MSKISNNTKRVRNSRKNAAPVVLDATVENNVVTVSPFETQNNLDATIAASTDAMLTSEPHNTALDDIQFPQNDEQIDAVRDYLAITHPQNDLNADDLRDLELPTSTMSDVHTVAADAAEELAVSVLDDVSVESETQTDAVTLEAVTEEAHDAVVEVTDEEIDGVPAIIVKSFDQTVADLNPDHVESEMRFIDHMIKARGDYEITKGKDSAHNIHTTLKKVGARLATPRAARVMLACAVDPKFITRELHDGSAFNVYSLDKLADIVAAVTDGTMRNAINIAIVRTMFNFKRAGEVFNGDFAKAAASDKLRVDLKYRGLMVSHTVSAGTAPTQASSTMQALETLGIVAKTGTTRNPVYTLTDAPIVKKLAQVMGIEGYDDEQVEEPEGDTETQTITEGDVGEVPSEVLMITDQSGSTDNAAA
jgi:hypothetical protein